MSTKIYNAYKLRDPTKLWPFLRRLRPRVETAARAQLNKVADGLAAEVKPEALKEKVDSGDYHCEWEARKSIVWDFLDKAYRKADRLMVRTQLDFTVTLSVREHKGDYYLIAHEGDGMLGVLTGALIRSRSVVEYHYQDSTDRPEEIAEDDWRERQRTWSRIMGPHGEQWWDFLSLNIVCPGNWWRLCPQVERLRDHLLMEPNAD